MKNIVLASVALLLSAFLLAGCGGGDGAADGGSGESGPVATEVSAGDAVHGQELYNQVCIACHGPAGAGVEGLGKPFTTSDFIASQSDPELLTFVKTGRPIGDPLNTSGVDMPPKGGNPALSDADILDIIAYMRSLQE